MKTPLQRVKNPTGRLDWLAAKLIERAVQNRKNPVLSAVYAELQPGVETLLRAHLGPRNRKLREVKKHIEAGTRILQAQRRVA
jgi:hypothetical protein